MKYKPHPLRSTIGEYNPDALFVGFGNEYTYDGAILGVVTRMAVQREVITVRKGAFKSEIEKLLKHGLTGSPGCVIEAAGHTENISVVAYSCRLIVEILAQKLVNDGDCKTMDEARDSATEWHEFNTFQAWHGANTPVFVEDRFFND